MSISRHFTVFPLITLLASVTIVSAYTPTKPKANKYKDFACKNCDYSYAKLGLSGVTIDDIFMSVYFNHSTTDVGDKRKIRFAYSRKTGNGGSCTGTRLGSVPLGDDGKSDEGYLNINNVFSVRIKCVRSERRV